MQIKQYVFKDPTHFIQAVAAIRNGVVLGVEFPKDGFVYKGTIVASHPESMSCSVLVESVTQITQRS